MKGQGRVYRRPGRRIWMLDYWGPENGRLVRVRESSGTEDEAAARRLLRSCIAAAIVAKKTGASIETPANRRVTLDQVLEEYLRDLRLREKKGAAAEEYRLGQESPLRRALGHVQAGELTREMLVRYAEDRRKAKKSNATINRDLQGLRAALRLALKAGRVLRLSIFPEKLSEKIRRGFFDREEVDRLCESAPACSLR